MNREGYEPAELHRNFTDNICACPLATNACAVILGGGGMRKMERAYPMSVIDLAPTIAHLLGTPIPKNAEGNVLKEFL